jgi:hypothetical protein
VKTRCVDKGVVDQAETDAGFAQLDRQAVVVVEVELKPERRPSRYPQVAQAQLLINEIEVVVQALRISGLEVGHARLLVVPGLERRTRLHGREDVDQTRVVAPFAEDLLDPLLFTEVALANELDLQTVVLRQALGVGPDLVAQRLGELGEVEDAHLPSPQLCIHRVGIGDLRDRACDDHAVEARQHPSDLASVTLRQSLCHDNLLPDLDLALNTILSCPGRSTCLVPAKPG